MVAPQPVTEPAFALRSGTQIRGLENEPDVGDSAAQMCRPGTEDPDGPPHLLLCQHHPSFRPAFPSPLPATSVPASLPLFLSPCFLLPTNPTSGSGDSPVQLVKC